MIKKFKRQIFAALIGCVMLQNAGAAIINIGFDSVSSPVVNLFDLTRGTVLDSAVVTDWGLTYDDVTGTGTFIMAVTSVSIGNIEVKSTSLTTNNNGSLRVEGFVSASNGGTISFFAGDMAVSVDTNDENQTTIFSLNPLEIPGTAQNGFLLTDANFSVQSLGSAFDFQLNSSLLAIADNPFPVYSPVPVPAAVWLFGSGLLGLLAATNKKNHNSNPGS